MARLGQHFLINRAAIKKIVAALSLTHSDHIIEIGPGKGALTYPLAKRCAEIGCTLVAIEKDRELAAALTARFSKNPATRIETGDAREILPQLVWKLSAGGGSAFGGEIGNPPAGRAGWKLVGNIPYSITGALLRLISELEHKPTLTILMIQREVAQRIVAKQPEMNLLAAITQTWATPHIIATLKPNDFIPPPTVDSAVITLTPRTGAPALREAQQRYALFKILFKQPRKTVLNNLRAALGTETARRMLVKQDIAGTARPQNLDLATLTALASADDVVN